MARFLRGQTLHVDSSNAVYSAQDRRLLCSQAMADIDWSLGELICMHLLARIALAVRLGIELAACWRLAVLRDGDYFDLPKDKFNAMTAGQRLDHFAKRIVKHGRLGCKGSDEEK